MTSSRSSSTRCAHCAGPIEGRRSLARYCGARCRVAAHRARLELEHLAQRGADELERAELELELVTHGRRAPVSGRG